MAYIWENYSPDKHFRVGEYVSPYMEIVFPDTAGDEVNPMLRFGEIFRPLSELLNLASSSEKRDRNAQLKEELENILFHFLVRLDRQCGLDKKQIRVNALEKEILTCSFGFFCAQHWRKLTEHDQRAILYTLSEKYESENIDHWFFLAAQRLWEHVSVLYEPAMELYYVYVYARETEYAKTLMKIIVELFWDLRCEYQITWLYHYGIIGADNSMRISEIQIV